MNKENLVYIKEDNGGFTIGYTIFKPHTPYRCLLDGDRHRLVYGESISNEEFENLFENAHERIMRHFEQIGLVVNGMPVSKKNEIIHSSPCWKEVTVGKWGTMVSKPYLS